MCLGAQHAKHGNKDLAFCAHCTTLPPEEHKDCQVHFNEEVTLNQALEACDALGTS